MLRQGRALSCRCDTHFAGYGMTQLLAVGSDYQRGGDGIDPAVQVLDHEHVDVANAASAGAVQCLVSGWSACRVANLPILRPTLTPVSMAKRK